MGLVASEYEDRDMDAVADVQEDTPSYRIAARMRFATPVESDEDTSDNANPNSNTYRTRNPAHPTLLDREITDARRIFEHMLNEDLMQAH